MNWFSGKVLGILGSAGAAIVFVGFAICKLAGSEPGVSWGDGLFGSLAFGVGVVFFICAFKWKADSIRKTFYDK